MSKRLENALHAIEHALEYMNPDEHRVMAVLLEIVGEIGEGIVRGQKIYGYMDLLTNDKNLLAEGDEEDRDWVTYRLMDMVRDRLRREKKEAARKSCTGHLTHDEYTVCPEHDR